MDPLQQYKQQLEYEKYIKTQQKNYIDLADNLLCPNDSVKLLADHIFNRKEQNLNTEMCGIILNDDMEFVDVFCILLELFLYGYDILTNKSDIFNINESYDDIIYKINDYLKTCKFKISVDELYAGDVDIDDFIDEYDYYCEIFKIDEDDYGENYWGILDYEIDLNPYFRNNNKQLNEFKAVFVNKDDKLFVIKFNML